MPARGASDAGFAHGCIPGRNFCHEMNAAVLCDRRRYGNGRQA
jgi:hypothetical protein